MLINASDKLPAGPPLLDFSGFGEFSHFAGDFGDSEAFTVQWVRVLCVSLQKVFRVLFRVFDFLFESFQESFLKRYNAGLPQWSAIISDNPIDNLLEFVKLQWSALDCEYRGTECVTFTVTKELKECLNKDPSRTPRIVFARWTVPSVLMRSVETSWSLVDCSNKWPSAIAELF